MNPSRTLGLVAAAFVVGGVIWYLSKSDSLQPDVRRAETSQADSLPRHLIKANFKRPAAVANFLDWAERFSTESAADREATWQQGIAFAQAHRVAIKELIQINPEKALEAAVPMVVRQKLPPEILAHLERRVAGYGDLETFATLHEEPGHPPVTREARINGEIFRAFTYGRRAESATRLNVPLHGVAVEGMMAVSENPLRPLEVGEIPPPDAQVVRTCPVSGITTPVEKTESGYYPPVTEETPAALEGTIVRYYCDGGHIVAETERLLEEERVAGESTTGGSGFPGGSVTAGTGQGYRTILYMRCIFQDEQKVMQSETEAWDFLKAMNDYFHESSYGKLYFLSTVTPVIMLPRTSAYYKRVVADTATGSTTELINDAKEMARRMGFPIEEYQHHIMIYSNTGPGSFGGRASLPPGSNMWLKSTSNGVFWHEMGHNLGPIHANKWNTNGRSVIGPGVNHEYGNSFDVLGNSSSAANGHFNASFKRQIGWLQADLYTTVTGSGTYRIWQFDQPVADISRRFALQITKDSQRDYWVEFRQKFTTNPWIMSGVHLNWDVWGENGIDTSTKGNNGGASLLDTTPGSASDRDDAALVLGRTFSDREAGIHITAVAKNATTPPSMDVKVMMDDGAANNPPTLSLAASTTSAAVGVAVNLDATAADSDGDPLAYHWNFDDNTVSTVNGPTVSKSWSSTGVYAVQCTASDMRGGATRKTILITVGTPTNFIITGTIRDDLGNPLRDVVVHTGTVGNTSGRATSDSDGFYAMTRQPAGSQTLTAILDGWTFTPTFSNPVSIGPSATGRDFTGAVADGVVKVEVVDPTGDETGPDGFAFKLTRAGSLASPQTVTLLVHGTATLGSDFSFSPAPTAASPYQTWIIPAGSSTLDLVATTINDTNVEGVETVLLSVIPTGGVICGNPQTASVSILDNETTLPTITLFAIDADAVENDAANTAEFELRRTGSLTGALTVGLTYSIGIGFASLGADYLGVGTTIVMPAGASRHRFTVTPQDDSAVEGLETIRVNVASGPDYRLGTTTQANAKLADDDINVVSVSATDSTATEAPGDSGAFTISRTGSTTAALKVDYVIGGTALLGVDYQALPGFVEIPAGQSSISIPVVPIDDDLGESSQTVILHLRSDVRYTTSAPASATVTITDNDGSYASVIATDGLAVEATTADVGTYRFTVRGGAGTKAVKFALGGSATYLSDYTISGGTYSTGTGVGSINVSANNTASLTITPVNDSAQEDTEFVLVTLLSDAAYTVDPFENTSSLLLRDNDQAQSVNIANTPERAVESATTAKFYLSRNGSTTADLIFGYTVSGTAVQGSDYTLDLPSPVTIPAGSAGVYITVAGFDDTAPEPTETITLTVTPSAGYGIENSSSTLLLSDNDAPASVINVGFRSSQLSRAALESSGTQLLPVDLTVVSGSHTESVSVDYSVQTTSATGGGADFTLTQGTLTFAPGETNKNVPIALANDSVPEDEEFVILQLTNPNGVTLPAPQSVCTVFILDDEPRVSVAAPDDIAREGGDGATFRFSRSGATTASLQVPFSVGGTAASPADFTALPASATIPAGQSFVDLPVTASADAATEGLETVTVTLTPVSTSTLGANRTATVTLVDAQTNSAPLIRMLSPRTQNAGVPSGVGLVLDASVYHDGLPNAVFTCQWSKISGVGGVVFANPTAPSTTATFGQPGAYTLRLVADDGSQFSTTEVTVNVGGSSQAWSSTDLTNIATPAIPGQTLVTRGSIALASAGTSLSSTNDIARFTYVPFTGDVQITARVRSLSNTSTSARAGVMLRAGTGANAAGAYMIGGSTGIFGSYGFRTSAGATWSVVNGSSRPPMWIRLSRTGSTINALESLDGITWTQRGSNSSVALGSAPLVGLVTMSASATKPAVAEFDNVVVSTLSNSGPTVNAGTDFAATTPQVSLNATVSDDGRPDPESPLAISWIQTSGPASATIAPAHAAAATAQFPQNGAYTFRAIASDGEVSTFDDIVVNIALPTVSVAATDAVASEHLLGTAVFTITRGAPSPDPLTVDYFLGGSATNGIDYANLPGSVTIPANQAQATVTIQPLADSISEGPETITLHLVSSPNYSLGTPPSAVATLADLPIDAWRFAKFAAQANNTAIAGDTVDGERDGLENVLEYALGLDPHLVDTADVPSCERSGGQCRFIYRRPLANLDLQYQVESSVNLLDWSATGITEEVLGVANGVETVRASMAAPAVGGCFMHLKVTR